MSRPVIEASGGIVERRSPEGTRIAVIYRERYGPEWSLPKGKRLPGETWQETALREVREEIGVIATIIEVSGATAYLASGVPKVVLYWRMQAEGGTAPFTPNEEVLEVAWLTHDEAMERLSHDDEAELVRKAAQRCVQQR